MVITLYGLPVDLTDPRLCTRITSTTRGGRVTRNPVRRLATPVSSPKPAWRRVVRGSDRGGGGTPIQMPAPDVPVAAVNVHTHTHTRTRAHRLWYTWVAVLLSGTAARCTVALGEPRERRVNLHFRRRFVYYYNNTRRTPRSQNTVMVLHYWMCIVFGIHGVPRAAAPVWTRAQIQHAKCKISRHLNTLSRDVRNFNLIRPGKERGARKRTE